MLLCLEIANTDLSPLRFLDSVSGGWLVVWWVVGFSVFLLLKDISFKEIFISLQTKNT
jgi:hypothetical protein